MSNQDIRRWAREAIKGNIGFLFFTSLLCSLPSFIGGYIAYYSPPFPFAAWVWALNFVSNLMRLGVICVVLELIRTGEQHLSTLFTPFSPTWIGKALSVTIVLSLWSAVQAALPGEGFPGLVFALVGLVISTALFPVPYVLFFWPDWTAGQVIREGFQAGFGNFWDTLGFTIVLGLPIFGIVLLMILSTVFVGVLSVYVMIFGAIGLVLYPAYMILAEAKFAMERFMQ